MKSSKSIFALALEESSTGNTVVEKEKVYYARLQSLSVLDAADAKEHQLQWQVRIPKLETNLSEGRMRVRATTVGANPPEYVQTLKIKNAQGHEDETSVKVSQDVFEQFSRMADQGMEKTRYTYGIPERTEKWEVDVFKLPNGKTANWVKIDFEYDGNVSIPAFPDGFLDIIAGDSPDKEEQAFIRKLYDDIFLTHPTRHTPQE